MATQTKQSHLTIELSPDEANAVVYAVSFALLNEGEDWGTRVFLRALGSCSHR